MRYAYAIVACIVLFILYAFISGVFGWKHGGGAIPMIIFLRGGGWNVEGDPKER